MQPASTNGSGGYFKEMSNSSTHSVQSTGVSSQGCHGITTITEYVEWLRGMVEEGLEFTDLSPTMQMITYNNSHSFMMWDLGYR